MLRTFMLVVATLAVALIAYAIYEWRDPGVVPLAKEEKPAIARIERFSKETSTRPSPADGPGPTINVGGADIPAGDSPMFRVFDEQGNARIIFQCNKWDPISDTEFYVTEPTGRVLLPGGQLAILRADDGEVVVQREGGSNYNARRGTLRGNVMLFIDRTTLKWRKENPDRAEPEQHPEAIVKIWLDEVYFDLELGRLESEGPILVQSSDATIRGKGLRLEWHESTQQLKLLRIEEGESAIVRLAGLAQLGIGSAVSLVDAQESVELSSGDGQRSDEAAEPSESSMTAADTEPAPATAAASDATNADADRPRHPRKLPRYRLSEIESDVELVTEEERIDTYLISFHQNVDARQLEGVRTVGRLLADRLEIVRDMGERERKAVEYSPGARPKEEKQPSRPDPAAEPKPTAAPLASDEPLLQAGTESSIKLEWTGPLVVEPLSREVTGEASDENRFHLIATGDPVTVRNEQTGSAQCQRLEYHDETQQIELFGTTDKPVIMQASAQQRIEGERIHLDREQGIAHVYGAGRMVDRRGEDRQEQSELERCMRGGLTSRSPWGTNENVEIRWSDQVEIAFGTYTIDSGNTADEAVRSQTREFIRHAYFRGNVRFRQEWQAVMADEVDVFFIEPTSGEQISSNRLVAADQILARGNVRMVNNDESIFCHRLEVDMAVDEFGRNVPVLGRAYEDVVARRGAREIRANERIIVGMASVPDVLTASQRTLLEERARICGVQPGSPQWEQIQQRIDQRRKTVITQMQAVGSVVISDPDEGVRIAAPDSLECTFDQRQQIERALVIGTPDEPGRVATEDFYVRGPQINFDMVSETLDVPHAGLLQFLTNRDLDGRALADPQPVSVTWSRRMSLRSRENIGTFVGDVEASSQETMLEAKELRLQFEDDLQPTDSRQVESMSVAQIDPEQYWIFAPVVQLWSAAGETAEESDVDQLGVTNPMRKQLVEAHAVGHATITSRSYRGEPRNEGLLSEWFKSYVVKTMDPSPTPLGEPTDFITDLPLLSMVRLAGPHIVINLHDENLVVEGEGDLLVLDYRLPKAARSSNDGLVQPAESRGAPMAALQSGGPSQTVFTWQNSMTFMNQRNTAVFDNEVAMRHAAGSKMFKAAEVARDMQINPETLLSTEGRLAELTCNNLLVQFQSANARAQGPSPLSRVSGIEVFDATGRVRLQDNNRTAEGTSVRYDDSTGLVRITGSEQLPAQAFEVDQKTGELKGLERGKLIEWNLKTGVIRAGAGGIMARQ